MTIELVNLDHFLDFWSRYNQTIIQALIVVTLILIVALVFITLFGSKNEESTSAAMGLSPELEKSLQKMLENQTKAAVFDFSKTQENGAPSSIAAQPGAPSAEVLAQVEKLKVEMAVREKKIQDLNVQLSEAVSQSSNVSKADTSGLEARIKELEARLAEYDIISEDIADLSRYKDENDKIKAELASLKGTAAAPASAPVTAAVISEPVVAAEAQISAQPVPPPATTAPVMTAPELQVVVSEVSTASAELDPAVSAAIDDDLMKEFAAAVEGQKAASQAASVPPPSSDNEDLMGQFESFVQKKEGS